MPAMRAVATTSPFGRSPAATSAAVSGFIRTTHSAIARRSVTGFAPTSIIRALPDSSTCVRPPPDSSIVLGGRWDCGRLDGCDQVAYGLFVALAEELDRIGLAVDDRLEEFLAVVVGGQRPLGPAAHLVEQLGQPRVGLAVLVGDLVAHAL